MEDAFENNRSNKREKIAVVVFVLAILSIFAVVAIYMITTHSLDLAATGIDEQVGQLDGYAVVVFEGNNDLKTAKAESQEDNILDKFGNIFSSSDNSSSDVENLEKKQLEDENLENTEPATLKNVQDIYNNKYATTCSIKASDYSAYEQGQIFERGNWRIGVLSVSDQVLNEALESKKQQIKKEEMEAGTYKETDSNKTITNQETQSEKEESQKTNNIAGQDVNTEDSQNNQDIDNTKSSDSTKKSVTSKSVKTPTTQMKVLQNKIDNLRWTNKADIIIVLASSQDVKDVVQKMDCMVVKNTNADIPKQGKAVDNIYVMPEPVKGSVGAILSSPAKMLSASVYNKVENKE